MCVVVCFFFVCGGGVMSRAVGEVEEGDRLGRVIPVEEARTEKVDGSDPLTVQQLPALVLN